MYCQFSEEILKTVIIRKAGVSSCAFTTKTPCFGFGKGSLVNKQYINSAWKQQNLDGVSSYTDQFDTRMGSWYEKIVNSTSRVGEDGADKLLLKPLHEKIEFVRSKLSL